MSMTPSFLDQLRAAERAHDTLLCVGLDPEPERFPEPWRGDASKIFDFCTRIVDATHDLVLAFKPQIAYFAAHRAESQLEQLIAHIRKVAPSVPVILDAKRGDIGATAEQYAREAFVRYGADAVTLSPYMGLDSLEPYLAYDGKGLFLLCRTSNPGGNDVQNLELAPDGDAPSERVFERVARLATGRWGGGNVAAPRAARAAAGRIGLVVGATYPDEIARVRAIAPHAPLLIPGVGAQGGDAQAAVRHGWRDDAPIAVNSSRAILYAGTSLEAIGAAARRAALAAREVLRPAAPR